MNLHLGCDWLSLWARLCVANFATGHVRGAVSVRWAAACADLASDFAQLFSSSFITTHAAPLLRPPTRLSIHLDLVALSLTGQRTQPTDRRSPLIACAPSLHWPLRQFLNVHFSPNALCSPPQLQPLLLTAFCFSIQLLRNTTSNCLHRLCPSCYRHEQ